MKTRRIDLSSVFILALILPASVAGQPKTQPKTTIKSKTMENGFIRSDYSPGEVIELCNQAISATQEKLDLLAKTPSDLKSFNQTVGAFEQILSDFSDTVSPLTFMGYVSTNEKISQDASSCDQKLSEYAVSIFTRKDLYEVLKNQQGNTATEKRLHAETLKSFEKNGLNLPESELNQVRALKQKLAVIESQFSTNLNQESSSAEFTAEELDGVSKDFLASLPKTPEGKLIVATKEPLYVQVMENAKSSETRRRMLQIFENRAAKINTPLMVKAIELRQQIAILMKYKNWVDYRTHDRMAKSSENIMNFLGDLKRKLLKSNEQDLARLLRYKKKEDPKATHLDPWDLRYYSYQVKKSEFSLDDEEIRQYFPADHVVQGMFAVYSKLLGVDYIEEKQAPLWSPSVQLFRIQDHKSKEIVGYFYADFFPRKGKYGHAAAFTLISGRTLSNGKYSRPVSSIVSNFSLPEGGKPSLLKFEEVKTLFHEFGHIMHQTLTRAPYASLSGSSVDHDFVEAPSQMLENWVYSKEVLSMISGHYQDHQKKLPDGLLKKLIEARDFNLGYFYTRQLLFGLLDMAYHTSTSPVDPIATYLKLYKEIVGIEPIADSHFPASFGHLMGGYDAGYYGYLWSEVYAADMFTQFEKDGLLNSKVGHKYRQTILEQGKMIDALDLVVEFLGRKPNSQAFYKKLHI